MDKIFYYRNKNNEVYEMKFKKVLIGLGGTIYDISRKKFNVTYIEVEVAGLGTLSWGKYAYSNSLCVTNIYDSIEKAIRGYNTNTLKYMNNREGLCSEDVFNVIWGSNWDCSMFDLDFVLPKHIFEVVTHNFYGHETIDYHTWVWDGFNAVEKGCLGQTDPQCGVPNSSKTLMYDIINKECIYDKDIVGYATREECVRANSVKIHRF